MDGYRLCILDWNGTLQDDMHHIYECGVQRIFRHFSLPCPTLDEYRHEVTADFMGSLYWPRGVPKDVSAADLNAIMAEGFKEKGTPPPLFPDAHRVVLTLAIRRYGLAVASGYATAKLDAAVARSGFAHCLFKVIGDVRDKAATFAEIMDLAGATAAQTAVIGDTDEDVLGRRRRDAVHLPSRLPSARAHRGDARPRAEPGDRGFAGRSTDALSVTQGPAPGLFFLSGPD
jgi:phosphoglycolate phosphatase-like HAD superfamily hydrolase